MAILILKPRFALAVRRHLREMRIEPTAGDAGQPEERAPRVVQRSAVRVVQADHEVSAGPNEAADSPERRAAVAGVMQDTVADDDIEESILQRRAEEIHLGEGGAVEP